jgi:hypothetical protein
MSSIAATTTIEAVCECGNRLSIGPIFNNTTNYKTCPSCKAEHVASVTIEHVIKKADPAISLSNSPTELEACRIQVLQNLNILDTLSESRFDRITRLAKILFKVPIALITFVDSDRQWFKSNEGLEATFETSREISFCTHTIENDGIFIIPDALKDPRFSSNPLVVGEPNIRFYAGASLKVDGQRIGSLCIIDREPRTLSDSEKKTLRDLANCVQDELIRAPMIDPNQSHNYS